MKLFSNVRLTLIEIKEQLSLHPVCLKLTKIFSSHARRNIDFRQQEFSSFHFRDSVPALIELAHCSFRLEIKVISAIIYARRKHRKTECTTCLLAKLWQIFHRYNPSRLYLWRVFKWALMRAGTFSTATLGVVYDRWLHRSGSFHLFRKNWHINFL